VSVKLDPDIPTEATSASSPLTFPFPEFVGEADKTNGVRSKVGVIENPSKGGFVQQAGKTAELEPCRFSSNAILLPVIVMGDAKFTVGP